MDYSEEMLKYGKEEIEKEGLSDRFTVITDRVENISKHIAKESMDAVLLHNVLSYVENPVEVLKQAINTLKKNGIFSLMQVNIYSEVYFPAVFKNNLDAALQKLDAHQTKANLFEVAIQRFSAEELITMVEDLGLEKVARFGISCLNTFIANEDIKLDVAFYEKLKNLEILMSDRFPYYHVARFNHLFFKKH